MHSLHEISFAIFAIYFCRATVCDKCTLCALLRCAGIDESTYRSNIHFGSVYKNPFIELVECINYLKSNYSDRNVLAGSNLIY